MLAALVGTLVYYHRSSNRAYLLRLSFLAVLLLPLFSLLMPNFESFYGNLFSSVNQAITNGVTISGLTSVNPATNVSDQLNWWHIFLVIWISGVIAMLLRILIGKIGALSLSNKATRLGQPDMIELITKAKDELNIDAKVTVKQSKTVAVPFVEGIFNPVIIVPESFTGWSKEKQQMVLYHELAHIKRFDTLWYLLCSLSVAVHWFNPLAWYCRKKMIIATEISCDDYVVLFGFNRHLYAEHILYLAKNLNFKLFHSPVNVAMAKKNQLEGRLMSILSSKKRILKPPKSFVTLVLICSLMILLPLSGMMPLAGDKEEAKKEKQKKEQQDKEKEALPGPDDYIELTTAPEMVTMTTPEYPKEFKKKGIEGTVWVKALVLKDGTVKKAMVMKSSGKDEFDKAAVKAAYKNKFKPGLQKDKPVNCWISYKIVFSLDDKEPAKKEG